MIAHLRGEAVLTGDRWVVIDVGGIGYQVQVTQPELHLIGMSQEKVKLYTYMAVREDAITLYGFLHHSELEMFKILIGVCLLYTSPSPRDRQKSRMPSSA